MSLAQRTYLLRDTLQMKLDLNLEMFAFEERGKLAHLEKSLLEWSNDENQQQYDASLGINPGHCRTGRMCVLSPLREPCSPN